MSRKPSLTAARKYAAKHGYKMSRRGIIYRGKFICQSWTEFIQMYDQAIVAWWNRQDKSPKFTRKRLNRIMEEEEGLDDQIEK